MKHNLARNERGSMLVLIVVISAVIFIPLCAMVCFLGPQMIFGGRAQDVVDAAVKVAATDLSRIVINDPDFGYVSLSNHPATGKATLASDGEPLPVTGINTLIGTLRQNAIIADELNNPTMRALVDEDYKSLENTIKHLNLELAAALSGTAHKRRNRDIHGELVNPSENVATFLSENLPEVWEVESVKLSLGWLENGSDTITALPQPAPLARLTKAQLQEKSYNAFTDYPVAGKSFYFAGLGTQTHLVSNRMFHDYDDGRVCSIVRLECNLVSKADPTNKMQCVTCCQPYSHPDSAAIGAMTLRFSGRPVPGLLSWREFLTMGSFQDNKLTNYEVIGGDFPYEREARMRVAQTAKQSSTPEQFSEKFYHWLRTNHARPKLDALLAMIDEPFKSDTNEVYTYSIGQDGSVNRTISSGNTFTRAVTADGQHVAMADTKMKSGASAIIFFRDSVDNLSTDGGKHGGQPLVGFPLGGVDRNIDHEQLALNFSKRNEFRDGLALDIEIGGTSDSTARTDVMRMREKTRGRKI